MIHSFINLYLIKVLTRPFVKNLPLSATPDSLLPTPYSLFPTP
ncbi:hypothetical protein [Moorena sp. SIO4G3]|nr:hypothetical protein [Moorena sp. SIO4G3]